MLSQTCCFTGHRDISPDALLDIEKRLVNELRALISQGVIYFGAGGARGFDALAAQAVLGLRETEFPQIRLILVLPCEGQTRGWSTHDISLSENIRARANKTVCLAPHYYAGCMQRRNRYLVEHSGVCLCYLTREGGGTAGTVRYARGRGLRVINIAADGGC